MDALCVLRLLIDVGSFPMGHRGFRRLRNTIVILEWVPDQEQLVRGRKAKSVLLKPLTREKEADLHAAFKLFDHNNTGVLGPKGITEVLRALDINVTEEQVSEYLAVGCLMHSAAFHACPEQLCEADVVSLPSFMQDSQDLGNGDRQVRQTDGNFRRRLVQGIFARRCQSSHSKTCLKASRRRAFSVSRQGIAAPSFVCLRIADWQDAVDGIRGSCPRIEFRCREAGSTWHCRWRKQKASGPRCTSPAPRAPCSRATAPPSPSGL